MTIIASAPVTGAARLDLQDTDAFPAINSGARCPVWCAHHIEGGVETAPNGRTITMGNLHEATLATVPGTIAETTNEPATARVFVEQFDQTGEHPEIGPVRIVLELSDRDEVPTPIDYDAVLKGWSDQAIRTVAALTLAGVENARKSIALQPAEALKTAAVLIDAARLSLGEPTQTEALSDLINAAFRLGRASNLDQPENVAKIEAEISAGPGGDPWFLADRIAKGTPLPTAERAHWVAVNELAEQKRAASR